MTMHVPLTRPDISPAEHAAVSAVLDSGWITTGPKVAELERVFGEACAGHAVAVSSCTAAMHLALVVSNHFPPSRKPRVVVPVWTFSATAEAVELAGMEPVFWDVDPLTLTLRPIGPRDDSGLEFMMPVHMAGVSASRLSTLRMVYDAAHSLPHQVQDPTCFSFHANKPITCGEGGMVVFPTPDQAVRARELRLHGMDCEAHGRKGAGHEIVSKGFKYNLTDIQAAIALVQFHRREEMRAKRQQIAENYRHHLLGCILPPRINPSFHQFIVQVPDRDTFVAEMAARGVSCGIHYEPLHRHRYWRDKYKLTPEMFPNAEAARCHAVSLPIFSAMTPDQCSHVIESVREILR